MQTIGKYVAIIGVGTAAVVLGYSAFFIPKPCEKPITYQIGTIDPGFGLTEADLKKDLGQAGGIWDAGLGRTLFQYDPQGKVTVNLVYDDRQRKTQEENKLSLNIDQTSQAAASAKARYAALEAQYEKAKAAYDSALASFNSEQASYETQVEYWNGQGGAPEKEYADLEAKRVKLQGERDTLEGKRQQVNDLADQANALGDKYNLLVGHINATVDAINNDGLAGTQFEEGVYISDAQGQRINIYQFDDQVTFVRVLAHEMGHALGLGHDLGKESIMSPVNEGKSLTLSPQDLEALKAVCKI